MNGRGSLAERGRFEPPVTQALLWAELRPGLGTIRPDKKHPCWREFVRLGFGSGSLSPVRFVRNDASTEPARSGVAIRPGCAE
jgi:hypothetical protein